MALFDMNSLLFDPKTGAIIDVSDEGLQAKAIEDKIDKFYRLKRLPPKIRKIAKLIEQGYNYKEIGNKLKTTESAVKNRVYHYRLKDFATF